MERLIAVAALTAVFHMINTLAISVRLSGLRTRRLATAISLFNVIFLLATTANTVCGFLFGSIVEQAINAGEARAGGVTGSQLISHPAYQEEISGLVWQIRVIVAAAAAGTLAGAVLIPVFVQFFVQSILVFEKTGSVPQMLAMLIFLPRRWRRLAAEAGLPWGSLDSITARRLPIPKTFLVINIIVTGIYTVGVLAAVYAGALFPDFRTPATYMSAVVNGVATVLSAAVVDPTAAAITDQAINGERSEEDVKQMSLYLAVTRFAGTLLAQAMFIPSAYLIKMAVKFLA